MTRVLAVVLVLSGIAACAPAPASGPPPARETAVPPSQDTLPPLLLRRIVEAVDGYRDGEVRYVVVDRNFKLEDRGHRVEGVFRTLEEAESARDRRNNAEAGARYGVFGPYQTVPESAEPGPKGAVDSVTVYMKNATRTYRADSVDALFWSLAAFDKFVVPYLTSIAGAAYAARQRELYRVGQSPLGNSQTVPHHLSSF